MAKRDSRKITVASLCHANEGTITTSTGATEQRHLHDYATPSSPDAIPICAQGHHLERLDTTITLSSLLTGRLSSLNGSGLVTQLHCVGRLDIADDSNGTSNVIDTTDGAPPHSNETIEHLFKVHMSTVQHCKGSGKTTVSTSSACPTLPGDTNGMHTYHEAGPLVRWMAQPTPIQPPQRVPQATRPPPPHTEEQKFFIMYQRIIGELSWPDIEDKFADFFNIRTRNGLTSVYYRLRKGWGMKEVLKDDYHAASDVGKVVENAARFQTDFLRGLGYFDQTTVEKFMQASIVRR